ncbi:hypothetical protein Tco_1281815 [Tanacetum coccineum]
MAAAREGFLTDEQREVLKTASENTEMLLSSSPKTTPSWLSDQHIKAPAGEEMERGTDAIQNTLLYIVGSGSVVKSPNFPQYYYLQLFLQFLCFVSSSLFYFKQIDGGGGKGTWGKLLDTDDDLQCDRNDPNYDSGEVDRNDHKEYLEQHAKLIAEERLLIRDESCNNHVVQA